MPESGERGPSARTGLHGVLPIGTVLRGYELKSVLGQGAFGITYRALDTTLHRDVAIKEYLPTSLALRDGHTTVIPRSPDHAEQFAWGLARFVDEARTLARLDRTPAIVRVFDFLEANGTAYMVMALVEGETLNKRLMREQRLAPEAVDRMLDPLLAGLEELHAATFLHRDIKPANIMLDARGMPTLIDFGASRAAMAERSTTMTAVFTPGYAAAEQFVVSAKLGPWTDIYGLSATLYHAVSGHIPPSAVERILNDTYEPLSELQPDGYPPALLAGLDAGLAKHAADRPQSIGEWRALLGRDAFAVSGEAPTRLMRKPGRLARAARRTGRARLTIKGPALWGATALALLMLGGGGYYAYRANAPASVGTAALSLTAEQLEQALNERRKADALAAEKRRLEEEAQRKANADAETKRQADAELEQARQARQKAEQELAALKTEIETRRQATAGQSDPAEATVRRVAEEAARQKAEAEATALRQAEEEAQKKAAAEAETKRQTDEALARAQAERQRAEEEAWQKAEAEAVKRQADEQARQKAEADAAAKAKADADAAAKQKAVTDAAVQKKAAEAAENALRLEPADRQRIQVALTSLGFDTRGNDGVFGPRSREMIAGWQQKAGAPATGFLDAAQRQKLLSTAADAIAKFDEVQKKAEDDKHLAEEAVAPRAAPAVAASASTTAADGRWFGTYSCGVGGGYNAPGFVSNLIGPSFTVNLEMQLTNGSGSSSDYLSSNNLGLTRKVLVMVNASGGVDVTRFVGGASGGANAKLAGRFEGNTIRASGTETVTNRECTLAMTRSVGQTAALSALAKFNGTYSGLAENSVGGTIQSTLTIDNGRGIVTITQRGCDPQLLPVEISPTGEVSGQGTLNCGLQTGNSLIVGPATLIGRADSKRRFALSVQTNRGISNMMLRPD